MMCSDRATRIMSAWPRGYVATCRARGSRFDSWNAWTYRALRLLWTRQMRLTISAFLLLLSSPAPVIDPELITTSYSWTTDSAGHQEQLRLHPTQPATDKSASYGLCEVDAAQGRTVSYRQFLNVRFHCGVAVSETRYTYNLCSG